MRILQTGKDSKPPNPKNNQVLFVDMWGNWDLYEDYYGTFKGRIDEYVKSRRHSCNYFNDNYIVRYERGRP